jgi:two-component system response regulator HydG
MNVEDLHHRELLELDPEGVLIRFAGQRALLLDAVAMGILRQYLVDNFGLAFLRGLSVNSSSRVTRAE